jgi:hypothetical protein
MGAWNDQAEEAKLYELSHDGSLSDRVGIGDVAS